MTVLVTGATGNVGRHLVRQLLDAGQQVRALTRRPETADLPAPVEVVAGDLSDVATLPAAFDGVTAAHLINFTGDNQPLRNGERLVDLMVRAGVRKVTMLGGWAESTLEPAVRASPLEWTQLRPIEFMGNTLADWGERLRTTGVIREPFGDRKSAPVHEADIAAVAAVALIHDGHSGTTYPITGPEVLSPRDKIRILGEATGRDLVFEELTPEQTRREWVAEGKPPRLLLFKALSDKGLGDAEKVEFLLQVYGRVHEEAMVVADTVERLTGRPGRTFTQWAKEHATEFRP
ncbi:NAD(P)H-binding protein [Amycolatopsis cynarae]|uniref:NAD(P)H-binding protein n=1 Tax=Amycolatopsis cynarae TaxID=2995223 RepID=A0ABY7B8B9_9PSEU|nr:NAD(P)H-binding protein [Amycolatopsis sp. HUAS 11-8]WAL67923.1 NAD(P)H-binding protein [Amycolatopsis sp. HUAS 11-8]